MPEAKHATGEWQPMETAPRDKTMVALIHVNGGFCRYGVGWYMPLQGWQGWHTGAADGYLSPTHWAPLPEAPK